ncbi:MAG: zinc ribbon domain-containing protein [Anaerolineae bacterium]|nr:zinc ribbon domain-containing protein [Anaerolineae bacterium]
MGTVLVVLLALAAVAFVAYPLVRGMRQRPIPSVPDLETQMAYADAEEIELDFRTGKLDEAEYEALTRRTAAATDDELERRIQAMRKTRRRAAKPAAAARGTCPRCGVPYDPGDRFCAKCGASLAEALVCAHCGAPYDPGDKFCVKCGKPL